MSTCIPDILRHFDFKYLFTFTYKKKTNPLNAVLFHCGTHSFTLIKDQRPFFPHYCLSRSVAACRSFSRVFHYSSLI